MPDVASYAVVDLHMMNALCFYQHEKGFLPLLTKEDAEFVFRDDAPSALKLTHPFRDAGSRVPSRVQLSSPLPVSSRRDANGILYDHTRLSASLVAFHPSQGESF